MLQGYVSHLRKTLEPGRTRGEHELLVSQAPGYVLRLEREQIDADRFERLAGEGSRLLTDGEAEAAATRLRGALALWRGPALDDLAYEAFARADVDRLNELRLEAIEDRIDADLALGRHEALVGELSELVDQYPLRERLRAQLMAALYRSGRQADALAAYREGRTALVDELGIEPGPALRELEQAILRQDPALGAPAAPPRPIAVRRRRRWPLLATAAVLAAIALAAVLAFGRGGTKAVTVRENSVAVIDAHTNALVTDVRVGGYPGPLVAHGRYVEVSNIGDSTISRILATRTDRFDTDTSGFSRAIDLTLLHGDVWAADGGTPGNTTEPPGTIIDFDGVHASLVKEVGPDKDGIDEEQTTIAASPLGHAVWAGNQDSRTVTEVAPSGKTLLTIHGIVPGGLSVVHQDGADTVWASDPKRDLVVRIDERSRRITKRFHIPGSPTGIAADGRDVWVVTRGIGYPTQWAPTRWTSPAVWRIDPRTNRVVDRIPLPLTPIRIALGAGAAWVTAERVLSSDGATDDATVYRVDRTTNPVVAIPLHTHAIDGIVVSHGFVWAAVPPSQ